MKFLIAGLGSIGRRHLRNLRTLGEEDFLLFRTGRSTLPDDELTGLPAETDLRRALEAKPQAVIVANPTALHLDVAIPAAEAGCHLLLEKPVSGSLDRLDELQAALQRGGGRALVGFQFRFHPGLQRLKQLLAEGAIGRVVSARATWGEYLPGWHPWEDYRKAYAARPDLGGGVVLTLCHPLDYLGWLLGEVESLWAFTGNQGLGLQVEDTAEIGLRFASGALAGLHLDYLRRPPQHGLEIVGTLGTLAWDNADGAARLWQALEDGRPGDWRAFPPPEGFDRNHMFLDEMRHFLEVVRDGTEPACTLEDGIYALKLALAAGDAGRQGRVQPIGPKP
jgi:predicted dehydrogenase